MKKSVLVLGSITIILAIFISLFFLLGNKNELSNQEEISTIVNNSNLELLLNLGEFEKNKYDESKLLEVAMLFAEKNGHMNETTEGTYVQYVNQSDLHELILELTGTTIEAPIQIEDFYYLYDGENEYYYCVPTTFTQYKLESVNHVYEKDNIYTIETTASKILEGEAVSKNTITTQLKIIENGLYTNYQVLSQKVI